MKRRWSLILMLLVVMAGASVAQPKDRIPARIDEARVALRGNVHALADARFDRGRVADGLALPLITLYFNRTPEQQAGLDALLQQQQDPSSPNYHRWLTPEQFAERFGVSAGDMQKAAEWLQAQGFKVVERSRTYLSFSGTAGQVRAAFGTELHQFNARGEMHFANSTEPSLPSALANVTLGIRGLNDFRPRARAVRHPQPRFTSSISGLSFVTPDDFATIYHLKPLYDQGIDGSGQSIAIMGQTDLPLTDVARFRTLSGLPANAPVILKIPGYVAGVSTNDIGEADLDVEWAGAVARKATIIFVTPGNAPTLGTFDSLSYAINHNTAPVLSISYGDCEPNWTASDISTFTGLFQQANTQGQTIVGPGGDGGAADCESFTATTATHGLAVDFPASSAFVTGVGGTQFADLNNESQYWSSVNNSFNGSALSYIPETTWNETLASNSLAAGGGGLSTLFTKPTYQNQLTPGDGQRDVPDISLAAAFIHEGFLICASQQTPADCSNGFRDSNGNLDAIGGTSAGAPTFAGMVALLNQLHPTQPPGTPVGQGNINPQLYALAASSSDAFHDITIGTNAVPCTPGAAFTLPGGAPNGTCPSNGQVGYNAGPGYDVTTGLGTVDAYNLISELANGTTSTPAAPDFTLTPTPGGSTSITVTHGTSGTFTLVLAGTNGFSGTVTFSCILPSSLAGVTCTPPAPMSAPGNATFTINASSTAKAMPPGRTPTFLAWNWGGGVLIGGLLIGAGERKKKRSSLRRALLAIGFLMVLAMLVVGCGGGSSTGGGGGGGGGNFETGTVVLQGVSQADVHIVPITVTVN